MTDRDRRRGHIYETTAVIHVNGNGTGGGSTRRRRSKSKHGQGRDPMHFVVFPKIYGKYIYTDYKITLPNC